MTLDHLAFVPEIDLRASLKSEFKRRKQKNSRYSLRAFAKSLGVSHASLSEIFAGKRRVSSQNILRFAKALKWKPHDLQRALSAAQKDPLSFTQLTDSQVESMKDWYFNAILELFLVEGFTPQSEWIAKALNLGLPETEHALNELEELGFLTRDKLGTLRVSSHKTSTLGNVHSKATILALQKQFLKLQAKALEDVPVELQSSMAITIPMDPHDLPEARKIIFRCIKDLGALLNRKGVRRTEVYRLQIGLFPLTRLSDEFRQKKSE